LERDLANAVLSEPRFATSRALRVDATLVARVALDATAFANERAEDAAAEQTMLGHV
jgi:hypothetical protein